MTNGIQIDGYTAELLQLKGHFSVEVATGTVYPFPRCAEKADFNILLKDVVFLQL